MMPPSRFLTVTGDWSDFLGGETGSPGTTGGGPPSAATALGPELTRPVDFHGNRYQTHPTPMNTPPIVGAKLARPRLKNVPGRPRLVARLQEGVPAHPLTLVRAGAGYGKTTLLAQYADRYGPWVVWYSLDSEDRDLSVFLWHLVAGFQRENRRFLRTLRSLLLESEGAPRPPVAAAAALNDLGRIPRPIVLVLDDVHLVAESPSVMTFLGTVIESLTGPVRIVMAARSEPPLPIARLRARRQVLELGPADLALTRDELHHLLETELGKPPSPDVLDLVSRATEGWVAAVHLTLYSEAGDGGGDLIRALRHATAVGSGLHDYLAHEVLEALPIGDREWMIRAAMLEDLDPAILARVFDEPDVESRLDRYWKASLIQSFEGTETRLYRFHALLREFLTRRYRAMVPAEDRAAFHLRAAAIYAGGGNLVAAGRQVALAGAPEALATFLLENARVLLQQGHYQALLGWFEELPTEHTDRDPWLRLHLGDVRHFLGDLPGAELEYERAQTQFAARDELRGIASSALGLFRIWNLRGRSEQVVQEGEELLQRIISLRDGADRDLEMRLLQVISGAYFYQGRYTSALDLLNRMETLVRGNPDRQAALWNNRGVIWASLGDYPRAARAFTKGLERPGARRSPRASLHLSNLALLSIEMGDFERALPLLMEALALAQTYGTLSQMVGCQIGLAHLHYRMGNVDRSLEHLRVAESENAQLKIPLLEADVLALRSAILCDAGQFDAARAAMTQALAAYRASERDTNWLLYRIGAAAVDLRAGRTAEAHRALEELRPLAFELEGLYPRTTLLFHLGEAERRLGRAEAASGHLAEALTAGRRLGYETFLREQMRRSFEPFAFLLLEGAATDDIRVLAADVGAAIEKDVLALVDDPRLDPEAARVIIGILSAIGGSEAHGRLTASAWLQSPPLRAGVRRALDAIRGHHPELETTPAVPGHGVHLTTLGGLTVRGPAGEVARGRWRSRRALGIFAYLALRGGKGVSRDRLIELFWPGRESASAARNFHPTLSYIRKALGDVVEGGGCSPRTACTAWTPGFT